MIVRCRNKGIPDTEIRLYLFVFFYFYFFFSKEKDARGNCEKKSVKRRKVKEGIGEEMLGMCSMWIFAVYDLQERSD